MGCGQVEELLRRALADPDRGVADPPPVEDAALAMLAERSGGDARVALSALERAVERARERRRGSGRPTILFLDEIHRFNKAQQDALLPAVEDGTLTLIGATTENPYFEVNSALLSRARSITPRISALPALTADSSSKAPSAPAAAIRASVVFPAPGGP